MATENASGSAGILPRLTVFGLGTSALSAAALGQPIRFANPVLYTERGGGDQAAAADLDGDGDVDAAVEGGHAVHIYFNDGFGALAYEATIPFELRIWSLTAADMDADGHIDLLWFELRNNATSVLSIWFNSGDGRTGEVLNSPLPEYLQSVGFVVGDVTMDGLEDVVFARNFLTISAFENGGKRSFAQRDLFTYGYSNFAVQAIGAGDFDSDGDLDIAATFQYTSYDRYLEVKGTQVILLLNDGSFPLRLSAETQLPWQDANILALDMTAGDFDGDGDLDLVVAGTRYRRSVPGSEFAFLRNDSATLLALVASHQMAPTFAHALTTADINTDGRLDVAFRVHTARAVYVVRNDGDFTFTGIAPFYSAFAGSGLAVTDLTGDGQYDFVHSGSTGFSVLENITELRGPQLRVGPLVRGREAVFLVRDARPGEEVHFLYSLEGVESTVGHGFLGGLTLDLRDPLVMGSTRADPNGRAVLRRLIPPDAPLAPLTIQSVIRRGSGGIRSVKSPFQVRLIED